MNSQLRNYYQYQSNSFKKIPQVGILVYAEYWDIPYQTHKWFLGLCLNQQHISNQLYARTVGLDYKMSVIIILLKDVSLAVLLKNRLLIVVPKLFGGHSLSYFRYKFDCFYSAVSIVWNFSIMVLMLILPI